MSLLKDIILLVSGAFAGVFADRYIRKEELKMHNKTIKKRIKGIHAVTEDKLGICSLSNAVPSFNYDDIKVTLSGKSLFISFPELLKSQLDDKDVKFHKDTSFDGSSDFSDLEKQTGILNLKELIEKHRYVVAEELINRSNGFHFNGEKFGVYRVSLFNSIGKEERSSFGLSLFHTDYFTHRVFKSIYRELYEQNHPISQCDITEMNKYNCFNTSFGINTLVIVDSPEGERVLLTERAVHSSHTYKKGLYHVTVNEGLSQTDIDPYYQTISIKQCLERGLYEELGLVPDDLAIYQSNVQFYDLFLVKNRFELGITSSIKLNTSYEESIQHLVAKDKVLEIAAITPVLLTNKELNTFVNQHEFIPHGLYALKMIAARRRIALNKKNI